MRHALLFALVVVASPALAAPRVWDESWAVGPRPDVHVQVDDGHVRLHAGPAGRVRAHVEYSLKHWGLVIGTGEPSVVFEHKDDQVWITARDPRGIGVIGAVDEKFTVDVTVPEEVLLTVRTDDGAVDCEPLKGRFTFETGDGAVRAHGLRGDMDISSGDGRVVLDDLEGRLHARTGDGHLSVTGRFDVLDLRAGDGRIDASARPGSKVTTAWSVETGDGAVTLRVPSDIAALLDVRTQDGSIIVELPITTQGRMSRRELVGELNGGGPPLRVRTADGSITLALSE